ncbi:MAG TPA: ABC transporter permease [Lacipirellulaceae bacterium]|nr:ABC transporter permease [Lacipirellulaceae bacterium]
MPTILTMAAKDLRLMSRDLLGLFFIVGFPIVMGIFFGVVMGSFDTKSVSLGVAVVDEDDSKMSRKFVEAVESTGNVRSEKLARSVAMDRVRRGQLVGMIAIPKGFGDSAGMLWMDAPAIEVGIDPSRKAEAGMLEGMIMQAMGKLVALRFQDPASMRPMIQKAKDEVAAANDLGMMGPMVAQMLDSLDTFLQTWETVKAADSESAGGQSPAMPELQLARIETLDVTREVPKGSTEAVLRNLRSKWDISFPQAMMWGVLGCAAGFAITIVRERKQGTFLRLQVAPVTRAQIVAGKALACFLTVIGVITVMVVLGMWLGMRPRSPSLLVIAAVSIAFCFVGIMILMSTIGKTEEAVSGGAWAANMFMAMFGGGMMPLLFLPGFMKTLSNFSPVKWSILALEGSIWRGFTLADMLLPCGILLGTGAICLAVGARMLARTAN